MKDYSCRDEHLDPPDDPDEDEPEPDPDDDPRVARYVEDQTFNQVTDNG